ncbi:MAG: hypothetical protein ABIG89_02985 [Candidatus Woesearchaeota archaeon]
MLKRILFSLIFLFLLLLSTKISFGYSIAVSPEHIEFDLSGQNIRKQVTIINPEPQKIRFDYEVSKELSENIDVLFDDDIIEAKKTKKIFLMLKNKEFQQKMYLGDSDGYVILYFENIASNLNTALMVRVKITDSRFNVIGASGEMLLDEDNSIVDFGKNWLKNLKDWKIGVLIILGVCSAGIGILMLFLIFRLFYSIYLNRKNNHL